MTERKPYERPTMEVVPVNIKSQILAGSADPRDPYNPASNPFGEY